MNKAIVVNSFGRGGSNILVNMLSASPDVIVADREFWQMYYKLWNLPPKVYRRFGVKSGQFISNLLFNDTQFKVRLEESITRSMKNDFQLREKRELTGISPKYVLLKVTEYDVFLNSQIERNFDHVEFIGLARNGYSLCDSWKRRGTSPRVGGKMYNHILGRMREEANVRNNYRIIRFEDMLSDPVGFIQDIYSKLELSSPSDDSYLYYKKGFGPGNEGSSDDKRVMSVINIKEWNSILKSEVSKNAKDRLSEPDLADFERNAKLVMDGLYD